jgi:protein-L-isoaspartate(D-aspartate) O-methyltransferase
MTESEAAREKMVRTQLQARGVRSQAVLDAMRAVPRHLFVPELSIEKAYSDRALPTAAGQTISQPYIVARMTELLSVQPGMKVLEVGTGSGYQTAILACMGAEVVTVERSPELLEWARNALAEVCPEVLGTFGAPIRMLLADGSMGAAEDAPYDRILVTAAAPRVPKAYEAQLTDPGRLVIPLGDRYTQTLTIIDRQGDQFTATNDVACRFVPLIGEDGWAPA